MRFSHKLFAAGTLITVSVVGCAEEELAPVYQKVPLEYRDKRESQRLGPLSCVFLPEGSWRTLLQHRCIEVGGSVEQYKHPCLVPDPEFRLNIHRMAEYAARQSKIAS